MTKERDPYSRVYWRAIDDPKFARVWDDDHALSAWLRLLVAADMSWPASATLYHGIRRSALKVLCDVGLVDMQTAGRYRIHGLDKERAARSETGRTAANIRHHGTADGFPPHTDADYARIAPALRPHSDPETTPFPPVSSTNGDAPALRPHPVSNADGMPSKAEQSNSRAKQEQSTSRAPDRHGLPHITATSQEVAEDITGRPILTAGEKQLTEWDRLVEDHGEDKVAAAFRRVAGGGRLTYRQLVWDAVKDLEPFAKPVQIEDARKADESEKAFDRRVAATRERNAEMRKAMGYDA
jgi:hypothetical protein